MSKAPLNFTDNSFPKSEATMSEADWSSLYYDEIKNKKIFLEQ